MRTPGPTERLLAVPIHGRKNFVTPSSGRRAADRRAAGRRVVVAKPYIPCADSDVLERLPEKTDPSLRDVKRLRASLSQHPDDLALAVRLGRRAIEASRDTGDPRFLGQAQAALAPWWKLSDPPAPALLLRATIKQSNHDFDGALTDLDRLIAAHPAHGQALLTRATVLTVQGKYRAARADCARIAPLAAASGVRRMRRGTGESFGRRRRCLPFADRRALTRVPTPMQHCANGR